MSLYVGCMHKLTSYEMEWVKFKSSKVSATTSLKVNNLQKLKFKVKLVHSPTSGVWCQWIDAWLLGSFRDVNRMQSCGCAR